MCIARSRAYDVGERFRLTGRVIAKDRNDFSSVLVGLYRGPGGDGNFIRGDSRIAGNGGCDIATSAFKADQRGQWMLEVL